MNENLPENNFEDFDPIKRARTFLRIIWQIYDVGGHSMGRSEESMLLEMAMRLMGPPDPLESEMVDNLRGDELLREARDWIHEQDLKESDARFKKMFDDEEKRNIEE